MKARHYELSYPCEFILWDGKKLSLKDHDSVSRDLKIKKESGINWIMTGGIQYIEKAEFDMNKGAFGFAVLLDEHDIKVSSIHLVQRNYSDSPDSQKEIREIMKKTVETCSLLKPKSLVIHVGMKLSSGTVEDDFVFFEEEQKRVGLEKMLDNIARNLKFMGKLANEHGIKLALENLGRFEPFGSLELLPKIVDAIDEPNVGYCIDSGHAHVFGESVSEWIRLAGKKLFETHFHDNHGAWASKNFGKSFVKSTKETDEHLSPGFGTIDWTDTANALNKINFDGPVGFETGGWPDCEESESFKKAISWWRNCEESTVHG